MLNLSACSCSYLYKPDVGNAQRVEHLRQVRWKFLEDYGRLWKCVSVEGCGNIDFSLPGTASPINCTIAWWVHYERMRFAFPLAGPPSLEIVVLPPALHWTRPLATMTASSWLAKPWSFHCVSVAASILEGISMDICWDSTIAQNVYAFIRVEVQLLNAINPPRKQLSKQFNTFSKPPRLLPLDKSLLSGRPADWSKACRLFRWIPAVDCDAEQMFVDRMHIDMKEDFGTKNG